MNPLKALESLESAARGNVRLETLKKNDSPALRSLLVSALSPQITFGVKKFTLPPVANGSDFSDTAWSDQLSALLSKLANRQLTGNNAQEAIRDHLEACSPTQAKWSERIIKQDLRLDLGAKDVNNALGENAIFQFAVPLAEDYSKVKPESLTGKWCVQPKLDGCRTASFLPANKGRVQLFSRTGKEWLNFESVRLKLQEINDTRNSTQDLVLDGEVVAMVNDRIDFQALQHVLFKKSGGDTTNLKYVIFDAATKNEWEKPTKPYRERYETAREFVQKAVMDVPGAVNRISLITMFETIDPDPQRMLKHSTEYVHNGFEGAMYRRSHEPVCLKRSKSLLKVKSFIDEEAEILGAVAGNGKYTGSLGSLTCKTKDGKLFEIGSGFSDEQRKQYWKDFNDGKLPKYGSFKYQEKTTDGIPRFPVWRGWRSKDDF